MLDKDLIDRLRVPSDKVIRLKDFSTDWYDFDVVRKLGKERARELAQGILEATLPELAKAQDLLYASNDYAILLIFQAMDAAGKDSTIKHVMSGINPQGCQVYSFKQPSTEDLDHTFLWRCMKALPERGRIGIFNRSYYEEVLVVRVHPELLARQKLPEGPRGKKFWDARYDDINTFERHLVRNGTIVLKFFLNVSKGEQKKRFLERIERPEKNWKFSTADVEDRAFWDQYMEAYECALSATSTKWAPWYVIPADQKWAMRAAVADILSSTIRGLDLKYPDLTPEQRADLEKARLQLEAENT